MPMKKLQAKREALRAEGGFTLMELLIVVAIIAVLAAIAIPMFMNSLARSRAATDADMIRNGYASAQTQIMANPTNKGSYYLQTDGTVAVINSTGDSPYSCVGKATDYTGYEDGEIGGQTINGSDFEWGIGSNIYYSWEDDITSENDAQPVIHATAGE